MKKLTTIIFILILIFVFAGCESINDYKEKIKEDVTEKLLENLIGDNAEVDITYPSASDSQTPQDTPAPTDGQIENPNSDWPENIPAVVPVIDLEIENTMKIPKGIILDFGVVGVENVHGYIEVMRNSQFDIEKEDINDKYIDSTYKLEDVAVKIYWYKNGSYTLMITW